MMVKLTHSGSEETLTILGISDWEINDEKITLHLPVTTSIDVPDELVFEGWELTAGSDHTWFTNAAGSPTEYLHETLMLQSDSPKSTVWIIPSETYPVLQHSEDWETYVPSQSTISKVIS